MTASPLVSVVIPAYNSAEFIAKTLDSVKSQTFTDYEIIVIDDGSGDNTKEIVDDYLAANKLKGQCIRQQNKKIAAARNSGIKASVGKFIALLDHDDKWYPEKLEKVMRIFSSHPDIDLVTHDMNMIKNGKKISVYRCGPDAENMYEQLLFKENALTPSTTVFKKEKAVEINGFRENPKFNTVEDYDFWMRLSKIAKFYFLHEILSEYLIVEQGASKKIDYHISNQEHLVKEHFKSYISPDWKTRLKMRRRLSVIYRSGARELLKWNGDSAKIREYTIKMMCAFPFLPKNIVIAVYGAVKSVIKLHGFTHVVSSIFSA